jgi:hypothetical protein
MSYEYEKAVMDEIEERTADIRDKLGRLDTWLDKAQSLARDVDNAEGDVNHAAAVDRLVRHLIGPAS